jgi:hypothetical protein
MLDLPRARQKGRGTAVKRLVDFEYDIPYDRETDPSQVIGLQTTVSFTVGGQGFALTGAVREAKVTTVRLMRPGLPDEMFKRVHLTLEVETPEPEWQKIPEAWRIVRGREI